MLEIALEQLWPKETQKSDYRQSTQKNLTEGQKEREKERDNKK